MIDHTMTSSMIMINFFIKVLKLIIIILNISYFLGFGWYIFVEIAQEI